MINEYPEVKRLLEKTHPQSNMDIMFWLIALAVSFIAVMGLATHFNLKLS